MQKNSKIAYFITSLLLFSIFDIYFSNLIFNNFEKFTQNPILDLVYVKNSGAAFSLLENYPLFLSIFSAVAFITIAFYTYKNIVKISTFSVYWISMLLSGIFCNMYERLTLGYVRDFFKLNFINFPIFNISDIFINISVFAIVIIIIKNKFFKKI